MRINSRTGSLHELTRAPFRVDHDFSFVWPSISRAHLCILLLTQPPSFLISTILNFLNCCCTVQQEFGKEKHNIIQYLHRLISKVHKLLVLTKREESKEYRPNYCKIFIDIAKFEDGVP